MARDCGIGPGALGKHGAAGKGLESTAVTHWQCVLGKYSADTLKVNKPTSW